MRFVRQTQTIRVTNFDDRLVIEKKTQTWKHVTDFYTWYSIRDIICGSSNCSKINTCVDKLAGKSTRRTFRERVHIFEIASTTKISMLEEFTCTDRRNWLFYIL